MHSGTFHEEKNDEVGEEAVMTHGENTGHGRYLHMRRKVEA